MIVVDSGVLIATADVDDQHHLTCTQLLDQRGDEFVVLAPWSSRSAGCSDATCRPTLKQRFLASIADDELRVEPLEGDDYRRMSELVDTYRNLQLGAVDAAVVAFAERLAVTTVATVDRRDFSVVRPRHVDHFELLPELNPNS